VNQVIDSFPQTDNRFSDNNFYNSTKQFDFNNMALKNNFGLFPTSMQNLFVHNNNQFVNRNQFQPCPQNLINRNNKTINSRNTANPGFYFNNGFNVNKFPNNNYIPNYNASPPILNYQAESFPFHFQNINNINNGHFKSNFENNNHYLNNKLNSHININQPKNFFAAENFNNRPITNSSNYKYSNTPNNKKSANFNSSNIPQKSSSSENPISESNSNSAITNNYFSYMFNDANANNPITGNVKSAVSADGIVSNSILIIPQNSISSKTNGSLDADKVDVKENKIINSVQDEKNDNNKFIKNSNNFQKKDDEKIALKSQNINRSIITDDIDNTSNKKQNKILSTSELKEKTDKSQISIKKTRLVEQSRNQINDKDSSITKNYNKISSSNENVEILKVVLMNVPGINSNDNSSLTFTIHNHDNLFESFNSFLTLNNISLEFEFSILVNIFQAISTIYSLNNSNTTKSDERSIKILHSIWKNHCFLVSQKTLFNKKNDNSFTTKNIENDLDKILNLNNLIKNYDSDEEFINFEPKSDNNNKPEKNLIDNIGVYNSSLSFEDSFDNIEEDPEFDNSKSLSCKGGGYDSIERMHYLNAITLLNKSF